MAGWLITDSQTVCERHLRLSLAQKAAKLAAQQLRPKGGKKLVSKTAAIGCRHTHHLGLAHQTIPCPKYNPEIGHNICRHPAALLKGDFCCTHANPVQKAILWHCKVVSQHWKHLACQPSPVPYIVQ